RLVGRALARRSRSRRRARTSLAVGAGRARLLYRHDRQRQNDGDRLSARNDAATRRIDRDEEPRQARYSTPERTRLAARSGARRRFPFDGEANPSRSRVVGGAARAPAAANRLLAEAPC